MKKCTQILFALTIFTFAFFNFGLGQQSEITGKLKVQKNGICVPQAGVKLVLEYNHIEHSTAITDNGGNFSLEADGIRNNLRVRISYDNYPEGVISGSELQVQEKLKDYCLQLPKAVRGVVLLEDESGRCNPPENPVELKFTDFNLTVGNSGGDSTFFTELNPNKHQNLKIDVPGYFTYSQAVNLFSPANRVSICLEKKFLLKGKIGVKWGNQSECQLDPLIPDSITIMKVKKGLLSNDTTRITNDLIHFFENGEFEIEDFSLKKGLRTTYGLLFIYHELDDVFIEVSRENYSSLEACFNVYCANNISFEGLNLDEQALICNGHQKYTSLINQAVIDIDRIWETNANRRRVKREIRRDRWKDNPKFKLWFGRDKLTIHQIRKVKNRLHAIQRYGIERDLMFKSIEHSSVSIRRLLCKCKKNPKKMCVIPFRPLFIGKRKILICGPDIYDNSPEEIGALIGHELMHHRLKTKGGEHHDRITNAYDPPYSSRKEKHEELARDKPKKARKNPYSYQYFLSEYKPN